MKNSILNLSMIVRLAVLGLAIFVTSSARAADASWLGTTDALWSNEANWSAAPVPGAGNTATFNAASDNTTITLGAISLANITFDTINAAAYTLGATPGADSITFGNGTTTAVTMNSAVAANQTINADIFLGTAIASTTTFQNDSTAGTLTLGGTIGGGTGGTAAAKTVIITGAGNTTISGVLWNDGATSVALTKNGTGALTLSGGNLYTGATTISAGVVNIQNAIALGSTTAGTTVAAGAALQIEGGIAAGAEALTLNGSGISNDGALRNISGTNTYGGLLTLGSVTRINSDSGSLTLNNTGTITGTGFGLTVGGTGNTTIVGKISTGTGTLTKDGTGTLILSGVNTYTGATTISGGTLQIGDGAAAGSIATASAIINNATLAFNSSAAQTSNSVISGTGAVTQAGTGTTTISGANTYTGTTTLSAGMLNLGVAENAGVSGPLGKGGSIVFAGGTLQHASSTNMFDYSGRFSTAAGQAYSVNLGFSQPVTWATALTSEGGTLTKAGSGVLTLSGANTYTGITTLNAGTVTLGVAENVGVSGPLGKGGSIVFNGGAIRYTAANTFDYSGRFSPAAGQAYSVDATSVNVTWATALAGEGSTLVVYAGGGGSLTLTGSNTYTGATTVGGGTFILGNGGSTGSLSPSSSINLPSNSYFAINRNNNVTQGVDFANGINGGASAQFRNIGTGTTTLNGANTYGGGTYINAGQLNLTNSSNIGTGAFTLGGGAFDNTSGAPITFANNFTVNSDYTFVGTNDLTFTGTLTLGNTRVQTIRAGTLTLTSGVVGTAYGFTKAGAGTLILSGNNTNTGTTTVNGGTLLLDKTGVGSLASTSALTLGGGAFKVKGATSGATAQTLGNLTLTAYTNNRIALDPNGGTSTTLTLGGAWTRGAGSSLLIDYSPANAGTRQVVTTNATTTYALSNGIYGGILVKDSAGVTGFATRAAGTAQAITRFDDTTGTTLDNTSNSSSTNFTTLNSVYTGGNLAWTGVGARSVNSLTIDTTNSGGTIDMGASGNILSITSLGLLFKGGNNATLTGGTLGANNAEVLIHQTGTGILSLKSLIHVNGSLVKDGTGTLVLDAANDYNGDTTVNEGVLNIRTNSALGNVTKGVKVSDGAALQIENSITVGAEALTLNGSGIGNDGALRNMSGSNTYGGLVTLGSATRINSDSGSTLNLSNTGTITGAGFGLTVGGAGNTTIVGIIGTTTGTLTKDGAGTLTLGGANTYTGATAVNAGTLLINGSISASSTVTVSAAATLGGNGTIGGVVTIANGGTISPGNSPGILNVGSLLLNTTSTTAFEVNGNATAGTDYDKIIVNTSGGLTLNGTFTIDFTNLTALDNTTDINLFQYTGGHTGDFTSLVSAGFYGGIGTAWTHTGETFTYNTGSQLLTFSELTGSLTIVPEPATWALLAFSLTVVTVLRRRRNV